MVFNLAFASNTILSCFKEDSRSRNANRNRNRSRNRK